MDQEKEEVMSPLGHPAQIASTNHDECFSTMSEVFSSSKNVVPHSSLMFVRQVRLLPYWAMALLSKRFSPPLDEKAGTCKHKVYSETNFQVRPPHGHKLTDPHVLSTCLCMRYRVFKKT